jgi:preprotein translocase subunit SecG
MVMVVVVVMVLMLMGRGRGMGMFFGGCGFFVRRAAVVKVVSVVGVGG